MISGDFSAETKEDTSVTGQLSATDPEGLTDASYFSIATADQPARGTASINRETGVWVYTPRTNFNGQIISLSLSQMIEAVQQRS